MNNPLNLPVLGFVAYSGTGKTTLLAKLIPLLKSQGLRIGLIKHAHHQFEIDQPGKDSYVLRQAGAEQVLIASKHRWALIKETKDFEEPHLETLLTQIDSNTLDLILVEGFKHENFPKIELYRPSLGNPLTFPQDDSVIAIATDEPLSTHLPTLDINNVALIAEFVGNYIKSSDH